MTRIMTAAFVALALAGGSFAVVPARADSMTTTTVTTSTPAYGYQDGYWDQGHAWHAWANPDASVEFRKTYQTHYYTGEHTGYPDGGWRKDTWWHN
jgi:hypothetical protein